MLRQVHVLRWFPTYLDQNDEIRFANLKGISKGPQILLNTISHGADQHEKDSSTRVAYRPISIGVLQGCISI